MSLQAVAGRRRHVPYRDHKLTSLLRDAVGGTAKVLMLLGPTLDPVGCQLRVFLVSPKRGGCDRLCSDQIYQLIVTNQMQIRGVDEGGDE